jgi:peptidoglycan/LPS O-acetylase OafA/YrhL
MTRAPIRNIAQLDALTGIRGVAAWFVVLYHMRVSMVALVPPGVIAVFGQGYLAVDLFFMLSGFVIWLNYAARFRERGLAELPHFWWRRFARIWPLHAAILSALVLFALVLLATGREDASYPFPELPLHFLLVQNWGFTSELNWNNPAWSISTEFAAYLAFPFIVLALPWERLRPRALLGFAVLLCALLHLLFAARGETSIGEEITRLGLWRCLGEFALGMMLCRIWQELRERRGAALVAFAAGITLLVGGLLLGLPQTAFVPACFAALLLALALDRGPVARLLGSAPLRRLGDVSYSTYLVHFPLFTIFKILFVDETLQLSWWDVAGFLGLVLASSLLFYKLLERPVQRWLNAHPPRLVARAPSAS